MRNEELIEILKQLPKDADVKVYVERWNALDNLIDDNVYYDEKLNEIQIT